MTALTGHNNLAGETVVARGNMKTLRFAASIGLLSGVFAVWGQDPACEGPVAAILAKEQPERLEGATPYVFKRVGERDLRLHVFAPDRPAEENSPAIVIFYGGGWKWGNVADGVPLAKHLAAAGMVAILADYRVYCRGRANITDEIEDAKSAIRWVRMHARELQVDPNRIAASGGSSGGHLALATAVLDGFDAPSENQAIGARPNLLILYYPCVDPTSPEERKLGGPVFGPHGEAVSPAHHIREEQPPMLVLQGTQDSLYANVRKYCAEVRAAGNRCDFVAYEGAPHGFAGPVPQERDWFADSLSAVDRFLADSGYLEN
jgi:acetyl esterase/lipase